MKTNEQKSKAAHEVLQLMDFGCSYQTALNDVLCDKRINRIKLEKELNKYI